jgi:hypothetical protein
LNCAVIVQLEPAASTPPSEHVVLHGNSPTLESVTPPIATVAVPTFHNVATNVALDVVPTAVAGNASLFHVIVNVDGVIEDVVDVVDVADVGAVL